MGWHHDRPTLPLLLWLCSATTCCFVECEIKNKCKKIFIVEGQHYCCLRPAVCGWWEVRMIYSIFFEIADYRRRILGNFVSRLSPHIITVRIVLLSAVLQIHSVRWVGTMTDPTAAVPLLFLWLCSKACCFVECEIKIIIKYSFLRVRTTTAACRVWMMRSAWFILCWKYFSKLQIIIGCGLWGISFLEFVPELHLRTIVVQK